MFTLVMTLFFFCFVNFSNCKREILDFTDEDIERLSQQWENFQSEDSSEEAELTPKLAPSKKASTEKFNSEAELIESKRGQKVAMFLTLSDDLSDGQIEELGVLWQRSLLNAQMSGARVPTKDRKIVYIFNDGSQAWEAKNFFLKHKQCVEVNIAGHKYKRSRNSNSEL